MCSEAVSGFGMSTKCIFEFEDIPDLDSKVINSSNNTGRSWTSFIASVEEGLAFKWATEDPGASTSRPAILAFSSGTTGLPKGAEITHGQVISTIMAISLKMQTGHNRRTLAALPYFHGLGLLYYILVAPKVGIQVYLMRRYVLQSFLKSIQRYKVTELLIVPAIVIEFVKSADIVAAYDLSSVLRVVAGAAPLSRESSAKFEAVLGDRLKIQQAWGMTEAPALSIAWDERDQSRNHVQLRGRTPCRN